MGKKVVLFLLPLIIIGSVVLVARFSPKKLDFVSPIAGRGSKEVEQPKITNPLNGVIVAESEKDKVLGRRPLVVQIGNNIDARPQWNVSKADIVYEVVAEGGITRFMAVFLQNEPDKVGPVRSIRSYFLNWIKELGDAMVMHDGWSKSPILEASAIDLIDQLQVRSLFRGGFYGKRDTSRFAPDNEFIVVSEAREHGLSLGWGGVREFELWKFKDDSDKIYKNKQDAAELDVVFWTSGDYDSGWEYDPAKNIYLKSTGGKPHVDGVTNMQLTAKNVIVQFAKETPVGDEKNHLLYANIGSGKALIFLDGKVVEATWSKKDRDARTKFYDHDGNEIVFNRGVIWVCVVPDRNEDQVTYK